MISDENYAQDQVQKHLVSSFFNRTKVQYNTKEPYSGPCAGAYRLKNKQVWMQDIYPTLYSLTELYNDDQVAFTTLALTRNDLITIDHHCVIFQTISPIYNPIAYIFDPFHSRLVSTDRSTEQQFRYVNDEFSTTPSVWHGPGNVALSSYIYACYPTLKDTLLFKEYNSIDRFQKAISCIPHVGNQIATNVHEGVQEFFGKIKVSLKPKQ